MSADDYLDAAFSNPDLLLGCLFQGIQKAQERFRDKLNTVDSEGNLILDPIPETERTLP